ncbi:MAG: hypothetical protein ABR927_11560 [Bacteroidales bacterium]|jgi:hypothetical protein
MKKVKIIAGISWAFLGLIMIIILFPGLNTFSVSVSKLSFMKLNPKYSGGEIAKQMITASCTLDIRKPVFNGFLKESNSGFVQLDWHGTIPEMIKDSIDFDHDGNTDFCISINRKDSKTVLDPFNKKVKGILISTPTSYGWAARVKLVN